MEELARLWYLHNALFFSVNPEYGWKQSLIFLVISAKIECFRSSRVLDRLS